MKHTTLKLLAAAALIAGSMQPAFAKTISKEFTESVTVERTVVGVDKAKRIATLRDQAGNDKMINVPDAFENLERVRVGDKVKATYAIYLRGELRKSTKEQKANQLVVEVLGGGNDN